ncbi:hypothetical protein BOTBODRAFT_231427 [Botryobasidium botryosum FD-172 SS1]|uniref:Uncharacterized protein n=1 Tax=Botryobasidium botryosum (strain FD-172 SS1) TaxID=930990 RepID=A0A067LUH4_BOTB1|nr:hypothetical protein BOTBODRAFT_231427 [Botryobasidium botryosum FD-172 SS1]
MARTRLGTNMYKHHTSCSPSARWKSSRFAVPIYLCLCLCLSDSSILGSTPHLYLSYSNRNSDWPPFVLRWMRPRVPQNENKRDPRSHCPLSWSGLQSLDSCQVRRAKMIFVGTSQQNPCKPQSSVRWCQERDESRGANLDVIPPWKYDPQCERNSSEVSNARMYNQRFSLAPLSTPAGRRILKYREWHLSKIALIEPLVALVTMHI